MDGNSELKINREFALKYERYRQREELQKLKARFGERGDDSDSGSSESSSEDSEVELDPALERDFYRTLSLLKKKDPRIYEQDARFYSEGEPSSDERPSTSKRERPAKPMYLKDYERKVILEKEGKYEDDEDSDDEEGLDQRERAASPSYIQEQQELKESFRKFIQDGEASDEEGESQLLTRRIKTQEEKDREEADYLDWLKGQTDLQAQGGVTDMKYLRDFWNDPQLDEKERFLRDYVLHKGYLEEEADDQTRIPTYDEVVQEDVEDSEGEGESFLERQQDFERKFNFRFEEPDGEQIKTYPRQIATSVRSKDERRRRKREEVKERKQKEKEQKQEQLKQLKNLKRSEILEKLKKLQELTGNTELAFSQVDLDADFDPQQHDQLMQKVFGEDYYGEDEEEKPQFEDDEEHWNWDAWTGDELGENLEGGGGGGGGASSEPHCDDEDFNMDADYDPGQVTTSKKQRKKMMKMMKKEDLPQMGKKKRKSHFAEVVTKNKPVFDPEEKTFEQYLDEYYRLDYEDIIDDLPCRFKYRQVVANDFGLSTEEILGADDKELNRWCSLKKTCMFRSEKEERSDVKNYKIKAQNDRKKREILGSVYSGPDQEVGDRIGKKSSDELKVAEKRGGAGDADGAEVTRWSEEASTPALAETRDDDDDEEEEEFLIPKKRLKQEAEQRQEAPPEEGAERAHQVETRKDKSNWSKRKPRRSGGRLLSGAPGVKIGGREFSRQRLKAYGLNPKRLYFRQRGRENRRARQKEEKAKNPQ